MLFILQSLLLALPCSCIFIVPLLLLTLFYYSLLLSLPLTHHVSLYPSHTSHTITCHAQLQGLDPDKPVEITLDASDEYDEEDKEDPSLSQGATPPELTPRSITEETPLEVGYDIKPYYTGPG
jgi:hypothetical protein